MSGGSVSELMLNLYFECKIEALKALGQLLMRLATCSPGSGGIKSNAYMVHTWGKSLKDFPERRE